MNVQFRLMTEADVDAVLPLEDELFGDPWTAAIFASELKHRDSRYFVVAEDGDQIVGYGGLAELPDDGSVQSIGVARAYQRQGIGTRLLLALMREAHARGITRVSLEVRADNTDAQTLYSRFGFAPVGVRPRYYPPDGMDALVMFAEDTDTVTYADRLDRIEAALPVPHE